jgi:hypothetical protein
MTNDPNAGFSRWEEPRHRIALSEVGEANAHVRAPALARNFEILSTGLNEHKRPYRITPRGLLLTNSTMRATSG